MSKRYSLTRFPFLRETIVGAHAHLIERLTDNQPAYISPHMLADRDDFLERAEHVRRTLIAVSDYIKVAIDDIDGCSNVWLDKKYLMGCIEDLIGETVGVLERAADDVTERAA